MKFVFCFDSFKESITAKKAVQAAYEGWISVFPKAQYECLPLSDGGEGLIDAVEHALGGTKKTAVVHNALGIKRRASYLWIESTKTAIIESAKAIGLEAIPPDKRNPLISTSFGLGELLISAHQQGAKKIIIGLGGSATVDGGIGMLQALGFSLLNKQKKTIKQGGKSLSSIDTIIPHNAYMFRECSLHIASDVKNPLLGKNGAVMTFSAQKGATTKMQIQLEKGMKHYAKKLFHTYRSIKNIHSIQHFNTEGYGAAGGLGASLHMCCNAHIHSGIDLVFSTIGFSKKIKGANLIISGEGKIDIQSFYGKVPWGVLQESKKLKIPVCLIAGITGKGYTTLYKQGVHSIFTIHKTLLSLQQHWKQIKKTSYSMLKESARDIAYIFKYGTKITNSKIQDKK